jgi:type IV pilus assembly protein PilX
MSSTMKQTMHQRMSTPARERGAVLFVSLVFLVLITLLALTAASTSVMQERMTGGLRNGQLALQGAESTARSVEWLIWNKSNNATSNKLHCGVTGGDDFCFQASNVTGTFGMNSEVVTFRNLQGWPATPPAGSTTYATTMTGLTGSQAVASLAQQPQYMIEDLGILLPPGAPNSGNGGAILPIGGAGSTSTQVHTYRITARATGGNSGSVAAMESYFVGQPPSY